MTTPSSDLIQLQARRSPWIPRPIDNTALESYMSCPRKFYYSMVKHRRSRGTERPALAYGTCWHAIMEAHYKTGGDLASVIAAAHSKWKPHGNPDDHRTLERCLAEYSNYLSVYGTAEQEVARWGKTVGFPDSPLVEMPTEIWWPGALHPYTGKIDRIYEHQGLFYVEDHKSTSALGPTYFRQFDPSNQMMGYAWLAAKLTGLPIAGVRINAHAVLKTSSKFERQTIMISDQRLEEWSRNLNVWMERLENSYKILGGEATMFSLLRDDQALDNEAVELLAFPHNFQACAGKYGQCQYSDVCTFPSELRPKILESTFDEYEWNPLSPEED